jgi:hypothetical protein
LRLTLLAAFALQVGCTEFATPAELDRPQILAIVAEPPAVAPGDSAELSLVVAGPDGQIDDFEVEWSAVAPIPEAPAIGTVEAAGERTATYIAPAMQPPDNPALGLIEAAVTVGDDTLIGTKGIAVGSLRLSNPIINVLTGGSTDLLDETVLTIPVETPVDLAVDIEDGIPAMGSVAWYNTVGEIELYRSTPTTIVADEPGDGWLFVVVRDGAGGVAWHRVQLIAE